MRPARVVTIVQARMGSSRLPGKILMDLAGHPLLERQIERLRRAASPHETVIATTTHERDAVVAELADALGVPCFRGDEDDVLARFAAAAAMHRADVVVRVTADCPLLDPMVLDACVAALLRDPAISYASNTLVRTYPRGLDVEVLTREALAMADDEAVDSLDREHVTRFIWRQPARFGTVNVAQSEDWSHLRWTVDTPEDLALIRSVFTELHAEDPAFDLARALRHAREHPALHASNAHVEQKPA